jgi:hypothetical protein
VDASSPDVFSQIWDALREVSGILTRVKFTVPFAAPAAAIAEGSGVQSSAHVAEALTTDLQDIKYAFADAFAASAALKEKRDQAASSLGLQILPRDFVLTELGLQQTELDDALKRLVGVSPFVLLERNLQALSAALPPAACAANPPTRIAVDTATVTRLRRLWLVLSMRLTRGVPALPEDLERTVSTSGASVTARFLRAVAIASQRAFFLLWPRHTLQAKPMLSGWLTDIERAAGIDKFWADDWWSAMADLFFSGLPLPGEMTALLLSACEAALVGRDDGDPLRPAVRDAVLMATLTDDAVGRQGFLAALAAAEEPAQHWGSVETSWSLTEAFQLGRPPLPARLLHQLASDHGLVQVDQCPPWEGNWVQRWWFCAYQQRIRSSRVLPSPLGPTDPLPDGWERDWVFMGFDPGEHPTADVDASALWCFWHLVRDSYAMIPHPDRQSDLWPDCIRRLARERYESTAIRLFACWLIVGVIQMLARTPAPGEEPRLQDSDDEWFPPLPDEEKLLDLIRDLQGRVAPRQLDVVLCVAATLLRQASARHGWLAEQLEVRADVSLYVAPDRVAEVVTLVRKPAPEEMLIRDRLSESMHGYKLLPHAYHKDLLQAERIRWLSRDDEDHEETASMKSAPPRAIWAHHYTTLIERAVRDGIKRLRIEDVRRAYIQGGGRPEEWRAEAMTLGQFRFVVAGALQSNDLQQRFREAGLSVAEVPKDRLKWLADCRNDAAHAQGLSLDKARTLLAWMNESFFDFTCALGLTDLH